MLLLCLLAVLAGAESFVDIARFGEKKIEFLRRFRPFHHGTPAHDHLGDIFAVLDAERFQRCFVDWVAALTGAPKEVVAIDGKTLRRSGENMECKWVRLYIGRWLTALLQRAPCKGAISQWETDPPGNFRSGR